MHYDADAYYPLGCHLPPSDLGATASYDLVRGELRAFGAGCHGYVATASVTVADSLRLSAPTGSGPITFQAVLAVSGEGNAPAVDPSDSHLTDAYFALSTTERAPWLHLGLHGVVSAEADVALVLHPNEAVALFYRLELDLDGNGTRANAAAHLEFRGLPPGYSISSCGGYPLNVGIAPVSWARTKLLYR
jgi:hypothetical protein